MTDAGRAGYARLDVLHVTSRVRVTCTSLTTASLHSLTQAHSTHRATMSLLVPASWNWQRDAAGFYEQNHYVFLALAVSYYPVVFGLRYFMKNKTELDLGKGHITSYIARI